MKAFRILTFIFALTSIYDVIHSFISQEEGYEIVAISVNVWVYRFYKLIIAFLLLSFSVRTSTIKTERE